MNKMILITLSLFLVTFGTVQSASSPLAVSCGRCKAPSFQGRHFYLPFCTTDKSSGEKKTHASVCNAICEKNADFSKGSCDGCEAKCSPIFSPVCSSSSVLYANECHAMCAGLKEDDLGECDGMNNVVPGKTRLPPNVGLSPDQLQKSDDDVDNENNEDEDV